MKRVLGFFALVILVAIMAGKSDNPAPPSNIKADPQWEADQAKKPAAPSNNKSPTISHWSNMPEGTPPQAQDSAPTKGDDDQSFWMLWCSMIKPTMDRLNAEMGNSPAPTISRQPSYSFNDTEIKGMASAIEYSAHCPYRLDPQLLNFALQIFKYRPADVQAKIEEIEKLKADMSKPAKRP